MSSTRLFATVTVLVLLSATTLQARSQARNTDFAPTAVAASAQELKTYLAGKSYGIAYASGVRILAKFGTDGRMTAEGTNGTRYYDSGTWTVEDGKVCFALYRTVASCTEARFDAGTLYLKRTDGEIVRYEPK